MAQLGRSDWIRVALASLKEEGIESVSIFRLADVLDVSRGSFYWHFKKRDDLLDAVLSVWNENSVHILERTNIEYVNLTQAILGISALWLDESMFDPQLDLAVRDWGRRSVTVHDGVRAADSERVIAISGVYRKFGMSDLDAFIRARILYFTQIGYYTTETTESVSERLSYMAAWLRGFGVEEPDLDALNAFVTYDWSKSVANGTLPFLGPLQ